MAGSRKPGPLGLDHDPSDLEDGTMCRALFPIPGPLGTLPGLSARADGPKSVASMTHEQRMEEAIRRAYEKGQISKEVWNQLPSVRELVIGNIKGINVIVTPF